MTQGRWHLQRVCALFLLVLAASPLTAPFSAGHPLDLFGGATAHVQSKKAPDDPIVSLAAPLDATTTESWTVIAMLPPLAGQVRGVDALHLPLRL
jgi:hypothetical protein